MTAVKKVQDAIAGTDLSGNECRIYGMVTAVGTLEVPQRSRNERDPESGGDTINIDAHRQLLKLEVSDEILAERRAVWTQPAPLYTRGVLSKFAQLVKPASEGAVTG